MEQDVMVNGVRLHCEITGRGQPLLLLHGNGEDGGIFDAAAPLLAERFTVVRPDARGHGKSQPVQEFHYADMAQDMIALTEALVLERPIFFGFSDGGIAALLAAIARPGLFSLLIPAGANTTPKGVKAHCRALFRLIYLIKRDPKLALMFREPNLTESDLAGIQEPVSVLCGERDLILRSDSEKIAANISNSRLRVLPGEGHGSYIVHSTKIARLILEEIAFWQARGLL